MDSLLQDSTFADFTIRCAGKEYKVHRQIIACHSQAFREYFKIKVEVFISVPSHLRVLLTTTRMVSHPTSLSSIAIAPRLWTS